jgi:hypothetical protein
LTETRTTGADIFAAVDTYLLSRKMFAFQFALMA